MYNLLEINNITGMKFLVRIMKEYKYVWEIITKMKMSTLVHFNSNLWIGIMTCDILIIRSVC